MRWEVVAAWSGRTLHGLAQWELLSRPVADQREDAPFVQPPREGGLPPRPLAALLGLLGAHTTTLDQCYVGVWEGNGWLDESAWSSAPVLALDQRTFLVRRGPIEIAREVGWRSARNAFTPEPPTILWPADRAWFIASDPDLDSTYVGGTEVLVEAVLAHPLLEAWVVRSDDPITIDSDQINGR